MSMDWIKFFENDRFCYENGMRVIEVRPGYAVAQMEVSDRHLNGVHAVQGGAIFTLADLAFAAASNSYGHVTVGTNSSITYFKSPKGKILTAKATELSSGRTLCTYNVDVSDENGVLIARVTANGYIKTEKLGT